MSKLILPLMACAVFAQSEADLKRAFEGKKVRVKIDMPATNEGVDLHLDRAQPLDFADYSRNVKRYGISLRAGDETVVTLVKVNKKNVELQLGGGGFGTFSDPSSSVYVPMPSKSRTESDLEDRVKRETDANRRRDLQRDLDRERSRREREERNARAEKAILESRKAEEIARLRLQAGSRFNIWRAEKEDMRLEPPVARDIERMLGEWVDFHPAASGAASGPELRRGMSRDEVHRLLGAPKLFKEGREGELDTLSERFETKDEAIEVTYVGGVVVKYSRASR